MKKTMFISLALVLMLSVALFSGCTNKQPAEPAAELSEPAAQPEVPKEPAEYPILREYLNSQIDLGRYIAYGNFIDFFKDGSKVFALVLREEKNKRFQLIKVENDNANIMLDVATSEEQDFVTDLPTFAANCLKNYDQPHIYISETFPGGSSISNECSAYIYDNGTFAKEYYKSNLWKNSLEEEGNKNLNPDAPQNFSGEGIKLDYINNTEALKDAKDILGDKINNMLALSNFRELTRISNDVPELNKALESNKTTDKETFLQIFKLYMGTMGNKFEEPLNDELIRYQNDKDDALRQLNDYYDNGESLNYISDPVLKAICQEAALASLSMVMGEEGGYYFSFNSNSLIERYKNNLPDEYLEYRNIQDRYSRETFFEEIHFPWDDLALSTHKIEQFMIDYPNSENIDGLKEIKRDYLSVYYFGVLHTHIYEGPDSQLLEEVKKSYENTAKNYINTSFGKITQEYLDLLAKYDFDVEKLRESGEAKAFAEKHSIYYGFMF